MNVLARLKERRRTPARTAAAGAPRSESESGRARKAAEVATLATLLLPAVGTVYLSFNAGGFFPGAPAVLAVVFAAALLLRVTLAPRPLEAPSAWLAVAVTALSLFAAWTLVSALWSDSPARPLIEFDRALLYVLALALLGSLARTPQRVRILAWSIAGAFVLVCVFGFVSRALPEVLTTALDRDPARLSYPLTYWNSVGLAAAIALVLLLHLTSSRREPRVATVLAAAAIPVTAATLLLTFSRGAIVAAAIGLLLYAALARPRALASGLLVALLVGSVAVVAAYNADLLATDNPRSPGALDQGRDLALTVGILSLAAAALRFLLMVTVDPLLERRPRLPRRVRRIAAAAAGAAALIAAVVAIVALDLPSEVERQYEAFAETNPETEDTRSRLTEVGSSARRDHWQVALDAFSEERFAGQGAGSFEVIWAQERPIGVKVLDAHSLYLEVLAELGLVGLLLLLLALGAVLAGLAARIRGRERSVYAALFAAVVAWAVRAGVDWDWEMPAVTLWVFAVGGLGLAASAREKRLPPVPGQVLRLIVSLGLIALAVTPVLVALSQLHLTEARESAAAGDCAEAIDAALRSVAVIGVRPEPYEVLGYCDLAADEPELAATAFQAAVARDPQNWRYHYGLAIARAADGRDPRPTAERARRLNPLHPLAGELVALFDTDEPRQWRSRSATARLPED